MPYDQERVAAANAVLATFDNRTYENRQLRFDVRNGRLFIVSKYRTVGAVLTRMQNNLACRYGRLGMGGTEAAAVAQLILWLRDRPRVPLAWFTYQHGHGLGTDATLALLQASGYNDPAKTCCILCGNPKPGDWWQRDGIVGPCCRYGKCDTPS